MSKDLAQRHWLQIEDFLKLADYVNAIQILNANIEIMLEHTPIVDLSRLVAQFPGELCHQNDDLCYVRAMVFARTDQQEESLRLLEQLRFRYRYTHQNYEKAVACCLELARIFISRERFQSALHYLSEEAEPLFAKGFINNPRLQAQLYLRKAEVFTDLGKLQEDYRYTHEAYALFQQLDDWKGQYYALTRLVFVLTQIGRYAEAAGKLDIAWTYYHRANLGDSAKARLLNFQIHLYWYQGKLQEAFDDGLRYRTLVDQQPASNFRVYARILQGNLQRGLGNYIEAENYYAETRALLVELNYPLFTPWVDAQSAWLRLLQGYYDDARRLIQSSLATSDLGQAMSFQITLAAIDLQTEQPVSAQRLLQESLLFYQNSGDELTVCVIHSYLALAAIRQAQPAEAISHLQRAMQWLSARHIDYFPIGGIHKCSQTFVSLPWQRSFIQILPNESCCIGLAK